MLNTINQITTHFRVIFGFVLLFLILIKVLTKNKKIIKKIKKIKPLSKITLFIIILISISIQIFISPHAHITFLDEQMYMQAAKDISSLKPIEYEKDIGWPILLSLTFFIFSPNNYFAMYTNMFLSIIALIAFFSLIKEVTKNEKISLIGTLILSLFPSFIRYSTTAETTISSITFIILSLLFLTKFYDEKNNKFFLESILFISFASLIRIENYLLFILLAIIIIIKNKKLKLHHYLFLIGIFILILPNFIQKLLFHAGYTTIINNKTFIGYGIQNPIKNIIYHFKQNYFWYIFFYNFYQPIIIGFISFVGLILIFIKKIKNQKIIILNSHFVIMLLFYLSTAISTIGNRALLSAKSRFYLTLHITTIIYCSIIINKIGKWIKKEYFIYFIIIILFIPNIVSLEKNLTNLETITQTKIPEFAKQNIPFNYTLIINHPIILTSTSNFSIISTKDFLNYYGRYDIRKMIFLEDMYCGDFFKIYYYAPDKDEMIQNCKMMKNKFNLEIYQNITTKNKTYHLYKFKI